MSPDLTIPTLDDRVWRLKAHALFYPDLSTQFGQRDARPRSEAWLERLGFGPLTPADRTLLQDAWQDAYETQLGVGSQGEPRPARVTLRHPVTGLPLRRGDREDTWEVPSPRTLDEGIGWFQERLERLWQTAEAGSSAQGTAPRNLAFLYRQLWDVRLQAVEALEQQYPWLHRLPGAFALPDHRLWSRQNMAAALVACRAQGESPAFAYLHVGPVQGFIESSRRTQDLWVSSYLVAWLALQAGLEALMALGPDALLIPSAAASPLLRSLGLGEALEGLERARLLQASIPNKVLVLCPERQAEALLGQMASVVQGAWSDAAQKVETWLKKRLTSSDTVEAAKTPEAAEARKAETSFWEGFERHYQDHLEVDGVVLTWGANWEDVKNLLGSAGSTAELTRLEAWHPGAKPRQARAFGALFDLTHRGLSAHRRTLLPRDWQGDSRPKCTGCGQREQLGPGGGERTQKKAWVDLSRRIRLPQKAGPSGGQSPQDKDTGRSSLHLVHGEALCGVCLTRRFLPQAYFGDPQTPATGLARHARSGPQGLQLDWSERDDDRKLLRFPSVASIATAPFRWKLLENLGNHTGYDRTTAWCDTLKSLHDKDCLDFEPPGNLIPGLERPVPKDAASLVAVDGTWLYPESYDAAVAWKDHFGWNPPRETSGQPGSRKESEAPEKQKELERQRKLAELLPKALRAQEAMTGAAGCAASSYVAVLKLDVDDLGQWLAGRHEARPALETLWQGEPLSQNVLLAKRPLFPALHAELSERVGMLASQTFPAVVERYLGRVVYTGGDDLLAFLPLQTVLPCLAELRRAVRETLSEGISLSAGIAVQHWRAPLSHALKAAREAEQTAKRRQAQTIEATLPGTTLRLKVPKAKDAWCLRLNVRSGAALEVRLPFEYTLEEARGLSGRASPSVLTLGLVQALLDLRSPEPGGQDSHPLTRLRALLDLEEELPALERGTQASSSGGAWQDEAFLHRLGLALRGVGTPDQAPPAWLEQCLRELHTLFGMEAVSRRSSAQAGRSDGSPAARVLNLLALIRFLAREEHGIQTSSLLKALERRR